MEYIGFSRLGKIIAEKQKTFASRMKDVGEFSYQDSFVCVRCLVFRNTETPN